MGNARRSFEPISEEYAASLEASVCPDDFDGTPSGAGGSRTDDPAGTAPGRALPDHGALPGTGALPGLSVLEADRRLFEHLAAAGFDGQDQHLFESELAAYGYPVMMAWMRSGEIIRQVALVGRPLAIGPGGPGWSRDDRCELAVETVARALAFFRARVLMPGQWDHARGASIRTYYMGACLFQFPNVYRRWDTERRRWHSRVVLSLDDPDDSAGLGRLTSRDDPAAIATSSSYLDQILRELAGKDPTLLRVARMRLAGYTDAQAAEHLGLTARSLEGRWYRFSKYLRQRYDGAGSA